MYQPFYFLTFLKNYDIIYIERKKERKKDMIDIQFCREAINDLIENHHFGEVLTQSKGRFTWREEEDFEDSFFFNGGATRSVIFREDWDFVLKIDGNCDCEWSENERYIYNKARKLGFDKFFASCERLSFNIEEEEVFAYVYEKCDCDEYEISSASRRVCFEEYCNRHGLDSDSEAALKDYEDSDEYLEPDEDDEAMFKLLQHSWGLSDTEVDRFREFCATNCVGDLHPGNWGFRGDKLVIIDYAAYGSDAMHIKAMREEEEIRKGE